MIRLLAIICTTTIMATTAAQADTESVISAGQERLEQNQDSQKDINRIHEQTNSMLDQYQALIKLVDDLNVYNQILGKQLADQQKEMDKLEASIANAAVIERQILPLLTRMLDSLEAFVQLDLPFLYEERMQRVANLHQVIQNPSLSNAEKARRVFEGFQIENDYGTTIETYKGKLNLSQGTFDVDFLRAGRIVLAYRAVGAQHYGYWDSKRHTWQPLVATRYQRNIDKGIKMANQEMAPELITLPLAPVTEH